MSEKKAKAIQWVIDNMKGLEKRYDGKAGENNVDSWYRFRSQLANEEADVKFCRTYYVGW